LIVEKPFLCIQLVYACVYIGEAGSKRRWFWIKDGDLFKLPAGSWKKTIYSIYIRYIYVKWIYTVYIYTRTVTVPSQFHQITLRGSWVFNCPLAEIDSSSLSSQQLCWSSGSFCDRMKTQKSNEVRLDDLGLSSEHKSKFGQYSQIVIKL